MNSANKDVHTGLCWPSAKYTEYVEDILSILFSSLSVGSNSLWSHGLQHIRRPCPSPSPRACSNSCPLSQWYHPIISPSVIPFSCFQSFPASGSFPMSQFFASGGQSIGTSASAFVLPVNIQGSFRIDWFDLLAVQGTLKSLLQHHSSKASILWHSAFFMVQLLHPLGFPCGSAGKESACNEGDLGSIPGLGRSPGEEKVYPLQYSGLDNSMNCIHGVAKSHTQLSKFHSHPYITIGKIIALTRQTLVSKVMSLLFNMLSRLVIAFLPRSKHLLISWLQ